MTEIIKCRKCGNPHPENQDCSFCGTHAHHEPKKRETCVKCGYSKNTGKSCVVCKERENDRNRGYSG